MERKGNTDVNGQPFDHETLTTVWRKSDLVEMMHPDHWRYDLCYRAIRFEQYGQQTEYGWVVDHIKPVSQGGTDDLDNLQPLHWETDQHKGDQYPWEPGEDSWPQSRL